MKEISISNSTETQCVFIPHHPVIRESSATTRLRVVFNVSSVTSNGSSLNDHLLAGPKLQTELPAVILQWRKFTYVYTADVTKMYRQIRVEHVTLIIRGFFGILILQILRESFNCSRLLMEQLPLHS